MWAPYLNDVRVPVVPDVGAPTAPGCLDKITPISADDELNFIMPFLGGSKLPVVSPADRRVIKARVCHFI